MSAEKEWNESVHSGSICASWKTGVINRRLDRQTADYSREGTQSSRRKEQQCGQSSQTEVYLSYDSTHTMLTRHRSLQWKTRNSGCSGEEGGTEGNRELSEVTVMFQILMAISLEQAHPFVKTHQIV